VPRPRLLLAAATACAAAAAVPIATGGDPAASQGRRAVPPVQRPTGDLARMLSEVTAANIRADVATLVGFGTRNTLSSQTDPDRGIGAARDWIKSKFDAAAATSGGRMTVRLDSYVQGRVKDAVPRPTRITNVVATLRGTQAQSARRTYVVSGHYDSRCTDLLDVKCDAPGADDDASGVSAILELARVMATRSFDATIVFMAVAGEEQGLFGSTHFAQESKRAGTDIEGMFTNDIVGSSHGSQGVHRPHVIRLFAEGVPTAETKEEAAIRESVGGENDSPSRQLARFVEDVAENRSTGMDVQVIYRRDRYLRGGDHIPFLERGYPAARFTEPDEDYSHQHQDVRKVKGKQFGDLPKYVDYPFTARVARVNGAALAALANGPAVPDRARIITAKLTNDTQLKWRANREPDLKGYEIVYRDTTAPRWQHTIAVGKRTSYTVKGLSKDNVFFGVRAIDRTGHRSPVAFPVPAEK
jgi:hypothetical protein